MTVFCETYSVSAISRRESSPVSRRRTASSRSVSSSAIFAFARAAGRLEMSKPRSAAAAPAATVPGSGQLSISSAPPAAPPGTLPVAAQLKHSRQLEQAGGDLESPGAAPGKLHRTPCLGLGSIELSLRLGGPRPCQVPHHEHEVLAEVRGLAQPGRQRAEPLRLPSLSGIGCDQPEVPERVGVAEIVAGPLGELDCLMQPGGRLIGLSAPVDATPRISSATMWGNDSSPSVSGRTSSAALLDRPSDPVLDP